jgi:hypothetical protein
MTEIILVDPALLLHRRCVLLKLLGRLVRLPDSSSMLAYLRENPVAFASQRLKDQIYGHSAPVEQTYRQALARE